MDERNMILGLVIVLLVIGAYTVFAQVPPDCTTDEDCGEECLACVAGECVDDSNKCPSCQDCAEGSCRTINCDGTEPCEGAGCVCISNSCIYDPCAGVTCGACEHCSGGSCYADTCSGDGCDPGCVCDGGTCYQGDCISDLNCTGCQSCVNHNCQDDNSNCEACEQCIGGSCSYQCEKCQVCEDNECTTPICENDNECNEGCLCDVDNVCSDVECVYDFHCGECGNCIGNECTVNDSKCGKCEYCEADGYVCLAESCGGDAGLCPLGCICSDGLCQIFNPPPGPEGCTHINMEYTVEYGCDENVVTITAGGSSLQGVKVTVTHDTTSISDTTDEFGKFYFSATGGTAYMTIKDLDKGSKCYDAPTGQISLDDIKTTEECEPACGDGVVAQDEECEVNAHCAENLTCVNCRCVPVPPPPPPPKPPECKEDKDCDDDEYCSAGKCVLRTGTCGYPENHIWMNYECCTDGDCVDKFGPWYVCRDHKCVEIEYNLTGVGGFVGESGTATAFSDGEVFANTELRITKPDGSYEILTTDSNGQIKLGFTQAGEYTIDLLVNGTLKKSVVVEALPKAPAEPERPTLFDVLAQYSPVLIILLVIVLAAYWFMRKPAKGKKK